MRDHLSSVVILSLIYKSLARSETGVFRYYIENSEFINKVFSAKPIVRRGPVALIECASKCKRCCACFGFNTLTNKCRVYESCDAGNVNGMETGWKYFVPNKLAMPENCHELYEQGLTTSGVYNICPWDMCDPNFRCVDVFCDMHTDGGGWTVLQRRVDGSINFNRSWIEYKIGFGIPQHNFWIGNDIIHQLTREDNVTLYVSIKTTNGEMKHQVYEIFSVSDESNKYKLTLGEPTTGTLGDSMVSTEYTGKNNRNLPGMLFTTYDQDNDRKSNGNCGAIYGGGWWFNWCYVGYLNGPWASSQWSSPWYPSVTLGTYIQETLMMVKPNYTDVQRD